MDSCQTPISEVGATISVYHDIGPDIGAVFEDLRYRSYRVHSDIGIYTDIGVPDIGYTPISYVLISEELRYRVYPDLRVYTDIGVSNIGVTPIMSDVGVSDIPPDAHFLAGARH